MPSVSLSASDAARLDNDLRSEVPADLNIPDNYVDHTLKNTKPLPPVTWNNWWKELNYLSLAILTISPSIALYGAFTTKARWDTVGFATFYYFVTGLGQRTYRLVNFCVWCSSFFCYRHHGRIPPFVGPPLIQRV